MLMIDGGTLIPLSETSFISAGNGSAAQEGLLLKWLLKRSIARSHFSIRACTHKSPLVGDMLADCQSASKIDPRSACNFDPHERRILSGGSDVSGWWCGSAEQ